MTCWRMCRRTHNRVLVVAFQCQDGILVGGTAKEMYFPIFTRLTFGYIVRRHLGVILCRLWHSKVAWRIPSRIDGSRFLVLDPRLFEGVVRKVRSNQLFDRQDVWYHLCLKVPLLGPDISLAFGHVKQPLQYWQNNSGCFV